MGCAFVFGDDIDTDVLAPGNRMKLPPEELAQYCMNAVEPDFAKTVKEGDFVFAGGNFGQGSSREQAAASLKILGVEAVFAVSFARIFYRNAMNLGLPAIAFDPTGRVKNGDEIEFNLAAGRLTNCTTGKDYEVQRLPEHLMSILGAGGLVPYLERRLSVPAE